MQDLTSTGFSLCVHCFHNGLVFHLWINCRPRPTTDREVMEKLITMGLDRRSFQVLVLVSRCMENSSCPQISAESCSLLCSLSLNYVTEMKSSLLNLPRADANPWKMFPKHCPQRASSTWSQICLVCDWLGSERGYFTDPGRDTVLHSCIQSLSDLFIT